MWAIESNDLLVASHAVCPGVGRALPARVCLCMADRITTSKRMPELAKWDERRRDALGLAWVRSDHGLARMPWGCPCEAIRRGSHCFRSLISVLVASIDVHGTWSGRLTGIARCLADRITPSEGTPQDVPKAFLGWLAAVYRSDSGRGRDALGLAWAR